MLPSIRTLTRTVTRTNIFTPLFCTAQRYKYTKPTSIHSDSAPAAVGAYSQAIYAEPFIYLSGSLGLNPKTMTFDSDTDVKVQTKQCMQNIESVLKAAHSDFNHVVKTTILLADINDFSAVNEIYSSYFTETKPARACYAVKALPKGALVEIEAIAVKSK